MAKKDKYRKAKAEDFFDYKEGKLSSEDQHLFERQMQKDEFDADAMEGLSKLDREDIVSDLRMLETKIKRRIRRNRRIAWYSAAATIAAIAVVTTIFLNIDNNKMNQPETLPQMKEEMQESPSVQQGKENFGPETEGTGKQKKSEPAEKTEIGKETEVNLSEEKLVSRTQASGQKNEEQSEKAKVTEQAVDLEIVTIDEALKIEEEDIIQNFHEDQQAQADLDIYNAAVEDEEASERLEAAEYAVEKETGKGVRAEDEPVVDYTNIAQSRRRAAPANAVSMTSDEQMKAIQAIQPAVYDQLQGQVSGVVRSAEDFQPLPGVSVLIKGTSIGTVTDIEGKFTFDSGINESNTLVASFVGMESEELSANLQEPMEIALLPSSMNLDEVVVVGYGTDKKIETTGNAVEVDLNTETGRDYQYASPAGGFSTFKEYINTNLVFPETKTELEKAVVVLRFTVTVTGVPTNFRVTRTPSAEFSNEAIRVIKEGPLWIPATHNGNAVEETVRMRIVFTEDHVRN